MYENRETEILLVEDNQEDAELAIRALRRHNLVNGIVHVSDGKEAIDFIFGRGSFSDRDVNKKPKLILLDLKLPKVSGLETLKILKGDPVTRSIPVVILTSSRQERDLVDSYNLGANSYLVKPVDFEKFSESVREVGCYWLLLNQLPHEDR